MAAETKRSLLSSLQRGFQELHQAHKWVETQKIMEIKELSFQFVILY